MGFLKRFLRTVLHENGTPRERPSSFDQLSEDEIEAHLRISRYGDFALTEAVRPSYDLQVVPSAGYRRDVYRDEETGANIPVLMAAASGEELFDTFLELLDPLGPVVDVVLETSHDRAGQGHMDLYREHIDMPVLKSTLLEFEDLLINDGCTGLAVLNPEIPLEVQFDEHKLLIMYGQDLRPFERLLDRRLPLRGDMRFITEGEHVHSSSDTYRRQFETLKTRLGMDSIACA